MATIADNIEIISNTKESIKNILLDNNLSEPDKFDQYPSYIETLIENLKSITLVMDKIVIHSTATLEQVNAIIDALPDINDNSEYKVSTSVVTMGTGTNVRNSGSTSGTQVGKVASGDVIPIIGTASSGWYKINRYRFGTSNSNPLKTYDDSSAYISNALSANVVSTQNYTVKEIDISDTSESVQNGCDYKIAESKGWIIKFGKGQAIDTEVTSTNTKTYSFNNCYTDNYSSSSYSNKVSTNNTTIRQGFYSGYYYYKGNIRFSSSRLKEVKSILNTGTVNKMELYLERANSNNGVNGDTPISVYACDSTGTNSDTLVDNTTTLSRGQGKWITLSDAIVNGFKTGKYNHFKVYKASTSLSWYIVYNTNPKLRITYTA